MNKVRLREQLEKYSEAIKTRIKRQIKVDKTDATGNLHRSIDATAGNDTINVFAANYIGYVEDGRRAGIPPPRRKIREWVRAKRIRSWNKKTRKENQLVYLITRAIGRHGTIKRFGYEGSGLLEQVIEQLRPAMTQDFKDAIAEDIRNSIRKPQES